MTYAISLVDVNVMVQIFYLYRHSNLSLKVLKGLLFILLHNVDISEVLEKVFLKKLRLVSNSCISAMNYSNLFICTKQNKIYNKYISRFPFKILLKVCSTSYFCLKGKEKVCVFSFEMFRT